MKNMKIIFDKVNNNDFNKADNCIMIAYTGSYSRNTYLEEMDDIDITGVILPPIDYLPGTKIFNTERYMIDNNDILYYSYSRFSKMLLEGKFNAVDLLWLHETCYIKYTSIYNELVNNKNIFMSKEYLNDILRYAQGSFKGLTKKTKNIKINKCINIIGYNVKSAQHIVRLVEQGINFIHTGYVDLKVKNADYLISIKQCKIPYKDICKTITDLIVRYQDLIKQTKLQSSVSDKAIEIINDVAYEYYYNKLNQYKKEKDK